MWALPISKIWALFFLFSMRLFSSLCRNVFCYSKFFCSSSISILTFIFFLSLLACNQPLLSTFPLFYPLKASSPPPRLLLIRSLGLLRIWHQFDLFLRVALFYHILPGQAICAKVHRLRSFHEAIKLSFTPRMFCHAFPLDQWPVQHCLSYLLPLLWHRRINSSMEHDAFSRFFTIFCCLRRHAVSLGRVNAAHYPVDRLSTRVPAHARLWIATPDCSQWIRDRVEGFVALRAALEKSLRGS